MKYFRKKKKEKKKSSMNPDPRYGSDESMRRVKA